MEQEPKLPENRELSEKKLMGRYTIKASYAGMKGGVHEQIVRSSGELDEPASAEEMEKKAMGDASALGLHNFNMDQYVGNKPKGWKPTVTFFIIAEDGFV